MRGDIDQYAYQEQTFKTLNILQDIIGRMDSNVSFLESLASQM